MDSHNSTSAKILTFIILQRAGGGKAFGGKTAIPFDSSETSVYNGFNQLVSGYFYLYNAHVDVVNLTDTSGYIEHTYRYDAFGNEREPESSDNNPFRYCGEYYDGETGSYYLRARYYDPVIDRFAQEDPHWNVKNRIYGDKLVQFDSMLAGKIGGSGANANNYLQSLSKQLTNRVGNALVHKSGQSLTKELTNAFGYYIRSSGATNIRFDDRNHQI